MKYIRTRHEIKKLEQGKTYNGLEIIKQADTIQELCDDFRFKDDNGKWQSFRIYNAFVKAIKDLGHVPELAFASIKPKINDCKLIDVAIMNEKGEWELL